MNEVSPQLNSRKRRIRAVEDVGFTLIELLVVIAILVVLVSIIGVVGARATSSARSAQMARHLESIAVAVETFESDFGYYPPLLMQDSTRGLVVPEAQASASDVQNDLRDMRFSSDFSLPIYLLGLGDIDDDGKTNTEEDDGQAGVGIRNPGPDKSWGGALNRSQHAAQVSGRVYGPYLDEGQLGDLLVRDESTGVYQLVDMWGDPIRYALHWPTKEMVGSAKLPSLKRTPIELRTAAGIRADLANGADPADFSLERDVMSSNFMLLSGGGMPLSSKYQNDLSSDFDPGVDLPVEEQDEVVKQIEQNVRVAR